MAKIESIWIKFESGVGFSNGCAAFALRKPPPFVPSILIATCDAIGPWAMLCSLDGLFFRDRFALGASLIVSPMVILLFDRDFHRLDQLRLRVRLEVLDHPLRDEERTAKTRQIGMSR